MPASPCGGSPPPSLSPSSLMTSCAASSVGDRGRFLRGAAGSAIVVSLCLRAGGGVQMSRGWCVGALVRCWLWGWRKRVPGGGCLPPLQGASGVRRCPSPSRPSSGAGSRGSATRVSRVRSLRAWGPSTGHTACALAGRRCSLWGWRKGFPGGGRLPPLCEGRLRSGAVPPPNARPFGGLLGSTTHVLWAPVCGCGGPTLSHNRGGGGPSPGGVACHRCEGRLVSGPVPPPAACPLERAPRVLRPVCPGVRSVRAWGPSTGPTARTPAGRR